MDKIEPCGSTVKCYGNYGLRWPADTAALYTLAALLLGPTLLCALPRTAVLGALLLTGSLGGAVAIHVRIGSPLFSHTLCGVYVGGDGLGWPFYGCATHGCVGCLPWLR